MIEFSLMSTLFPISVLSSLVVGDHENGKASSEFMPPGHRDNWPKQENEDAHIHMNTIIVAKIFEILFSIFVLLYR